MSTLADEINNQISAGRKTIQRSLDDMPKRIPDEPVPRAVVMATGLAVFAAAVGLGWMLYRRRRHRSLVEKLQVALPEKAKRPLARVVKGL